MKRYLLLVLIVMLFCSGCGVEWFPENKASATTSPSLAMSIAPVAITTATGSNAGLTFTIVNASGSPVQSGLGFSDTLPPGLTVTAATSQCGGTVSTSGTKITFTGGALASGTTSCAITASVAGTTAGTYTNKSTDIADLTGGLQNSTTDKVLKIFDSSKSVAFGDGSVSVSNLTASVAGSTATEVTYTVTVDVTNTDTTLGAVANVTVAVIAVDNTGQDIATTATNILSTIDANSTTQFADFPAVPVAQAATILLWRIVSVSATL